MSHGALRIWYNLLSKAFWKGLSMENISQRQTFSIKKCLTRLQFDLWSLKLSLDNCSQAATLLLQKLRHITYQTRKKEKKKSVTACSNIPKNHCCGHHV